MAETVKRRLALKRELGLLHTTLYGVGIILGAGIYALVGEAAGIAGNMVWFSFIIAALIASFTGLSYAELSSMFPKAAGEYVYTEKAFGKKLLSFLVGWFLIVAGVVATATVSIGFANYFGSLFSVSVLPVAIALVILFSILNFWGIKESANFNILSTLIEVGGLVIIIIVGILFVDPTKIEFFASPNGVPGIILGTAIVFFAFIGFEDLVKVSEETKNARKIIPKALLLSLAISTILYILVAVSAIGILGWETLSTSKAPLTSVLAVAVGDEASILMSFIALFSTANTVLILLIATSRTIYGISSEGSLPSIFSTIHKKRRTPWVSIITVMTVSILAVFIEDIGTIAFMTTESIFIVFVFVNLAVIWLRFKKPKTPRPFKVPLNIGRFPVVPTLGAISSFLMIFTFEKFVHLFALSMLLIGLLVYFSLNKK
jgi:APA family basic amino acid/polyamine antiporter